MGTKDFSPLSYIRWTPKEAAEKTSPLALAPGCLPAAVCGVWVGGRCTAGAWRGQWAESSRQRLVKVVPGIPSCLSQCMVQHSQHLLHDALLPSSGKDLCSQTTRKHFYTEVQVARRRQRLQTRPVGASSVLPAPSLTQPDTRCT